MTRKPENPADEPVEVQPDTPPRQEEELDAPAEQDATPESVEPTTDAEGAVVEAVVSGEAPAEDEAEAPPLESAGEMEEDLTADLFDQELAQLMTTPVGLRGAIEALLFISPDPLTPRRMANVLGLTDVRVVGAMVQQLQIDYDQARRGLQILETARGYRMATRELFGELVLRLKGRKRRAPLSPAALETLAILAYRQPMIRAEVEAIRGVESSGTIRNLIDMNLIEMVGRKDVLGRPPMYGTTDHFLEIFGLKSIEELPPIAELKRRFGEAEAERERTEAESAEAERQVRMQALAEATIEPAAESDEDADTFDTTDEESPDPETAKDDLIEAEPDAEDLREEDGALDENDGFEDEDDWNDEEDIEDEDDDDFEDADELDEEDEDEDEDEEEEEDEFEDDEDDDEDEDDPHRT